MDGGGWREGGLEGADVARGVHYSYGEVCFLLEKPCESHERDDMALGHEGKEDCMFPLVGHFNGGLGWILKEESWRLADFIFQRKGCMVVHALLRFLFYS